jgi:hypothetical protein
MGTKLLTQVLASSDEDDTISTWINVFRPVLIVVNFFGIPLRMKNDGDPTHLSVWFVDIYVDPVLYQRRIYPDCHSHGPPSHYRSPLERSGAHFTSYGANQSIVGHSFCS